MKTVHARVTFRLTGLSTARSTSPRQTRITAVDARLLLLRGPRAPTRPPPARPGTAPMGPAAAVPAAPPALDHDT